jgi:hypothetical protein
LAVVGATTPAIFAAVQGDLIPEFDWLERAVVMKGLTTVTAALWIAVSCFVADMLAELGNSAYVSAT